MPAPTSPVDELVIRRGRSGNSSMISSLGAPSSTALMLPDLPQQHHQAELQPPTSILKNSSHLSSSKNGRYHGGRSSSTTRGAMVLHGRVVHSAPSSENDIAPGDEAEALRKNTNNRHHSSEKQQQRPPQYHHQQQRQQQSSSSSSRMFREQPGTVRENMQRKSKYYGLREDVQKYRQQVQSLEQVLRLFAATNDASSNSGSRRYKPEPEPSQEEAWRLRILVKSAIDKDKILWDRLYEFERSLKEADEQNDCVKLHRDFKRTHKALVMCLSLIDENRGNHAVLRQLGGVGWARISQPDEDEDDESWQPKQPKGDGRFEFRPLTLQEQQKPPVAFEPVKPNAIDYDPVEYEESLTDTKTTKTEENTIDFASIDDRTLEDESDACFNTCLSPADLLCGASFMNCDQSSSKKQDRTSERSNHWVMTLKMIQQDMKAMQRSMARSCRKA